MTFRPRGGLARRSRSAIGIATALILAVLLAVPVAADGDGLRSPTVTPRQGTTATTFSFAVTYRNEDGVGPDAVIVTVGGVSRTMHGNGTEWAEGVRFTWAGSLPVGEHDVMFRATHGSHRPDRVSGGQVFVDGAPQSTPAPIPSPTSTPPPTSKPTPVPTASPSPTPTAKPTAAPTPTPTAKPTPTPTAKPTPTPSAQPTRPPTQGPIPTSAPDPGPGPTSEPGGPAEPTPGASGAAGPAPTAGPAKSGTPDDSSPDPREPGIVGAAGGSGGTGGKGGPRSPLGPIPPAEGPPGGVAAPDPDQRGWSAPQPTGSWGDLTHALEVLGIESTGGPQLTLTTALVGSSGAVAMAMAFGVFGKRRRDGEPPEPDEVLEARAARGDTAIADGSLVPASAQLATVPAPVAARPVDAEAALPRWRRPSLLEARKADPVREARPIVTMRFDHGAVQALDGLERRLIRYTVVELLDAPDELRSAKIGSLTQGDEVQLLERTGSYWRVLCPDGQEGWLHRMTLGDVVGEPPAPTASQAWGPGSGGDEVDDDVLAAFIAARGRD